MSDFIGFFETRTWAFIDAIVTTLTLLLIFYNWYVNYKQSQKVNIIFQSPNGTKYIFAQIIRKHISRAEILGILGNIQKNSTNRYNIAYLSNKQYWENITRAQNGHTKDIIIEVTEDELKQFEVNA